jgi:hypothetical protein
MPKHISILSHITSQEVDLMLYRPLKVALIACYTSQMRAKCPNEDLSRPREILQKP